MEDVLRSHATPRRRRTPYEWMMYHILKKQLGKYADWHIADGYHLLLDVYGKTLRIHHGDGLKYQGGIGGLTIPVEKAIASWNKGIPADLDIFGHWHQSQQNPKWVSNSSLIGYNAYSVAIKAPFEPPSQTLFMFRQTTWTHRDVPDFPRLINSERLVKNRSSGISPENRNSESILLGR
jgi:hypothetical protein